ncbi:cupin domain-containing protein [Streptomyces sp. NA04227]|uniref:cupin domain-containing protein n=1 Tax=Streptomyces sp. NA04227 TaxID=2742136 RepID=UPI001590D265|nr:cupin domain-containing protein [Streptomyces sp. NA04227]QKW10497.1 cupin domain-containing protein [Streptomyces sp. NA04227]
MSQSVGVLAEVSEVLAAAGESSGGALWRLAAEPRQLDANLVRLGPDAVVGAHEEHTLDVLAFVVRGGGSLRALAGPGSETHTLVPGSLFWLPKGSRREIGAGPQGLVYLTVHPRRPGLAIRMPESAEGGEAACQLHRVCAECGRLAGERDARFCARCGATLGEPGQPEL